MDRNKWRILKSVWGNWLVYPPGFPELPEARAPKFEDAIELLQALQCERYMRSRRWRDG